MAPSKIRKAIGAVKDHTSIGLAKVGGSTSISNLEVAIVKATRHEEYPPDNRYISEILSITSCSNHLINVCINIIARRLNKTKNWVVALKILMLIQRLISQGGHDFDKEIFFTTRRGTKFLNMCDFRDDSTRNGWDYSAFVRTYGLYLDEQLEFRMQGKKGKQRGGYTSNGDEQEEEDCGGGGGAPNSIVVVPRATPVAAMRNVVVFSRVHNLMQILDRFLACRPTGAAKNNRVVAVALYPIVKESFQLLHNITEGMATLIDRFMQLQVSEMVQVHDIFCRVSKQFDELDSFYEWCKTVGIMRFSEYPDVEKISQNKLDMMDDFIRQKSASRKRKPAATTPNPEPASPLTNKVVVPEKALPEPEGLVKETKKEEVKTEETREEDKKIQEIGDLLDMNEDTPDPQEQENRFALALFQGEHATTANDGKTTPWEAFRDSSSGDWEMALVQSASHFSNQKSSLPQGFDAFTLDWMYQNGPIAQVLPSGSSSSVAATNTTTGRPTMLALPAPASSNSTTHDPFAASVSVAPPPYLQMFELEKKQRMLVEEQLLWQQYARDGMHGQVGLSKPQHQHNMSYPYIPGGYTQTW